MTGYEQRFYEMFPTLIRCVGAVADNNEEIKKELQRLNKNIETLIETLNNR